MTDADLAAYRQAHGQGWLEKAGDWAGDHLSEIGHGALDVIGLIPVVGEVADLANAAWYTAEGDYTMAALSAAAAIPFVGWAATGAKVGAKGARAVKGLKGADALKGAGGRALSGPQTLIHYTSEAGEKGILESGTLRASLDPKHARHGPGQYFTDIRPEQVGARSQRGLTPEQVAEGQISQGQLARRLYGQPFAGNKLDRFVEIDVSGLPTKNPAPNIYRVPGTESLDLTGRIVRSGPVL
jgi:hypothetical protein